MTVFPRECRAWVGKEEFPPLPTCGILLPTMEYHFFHLISHVFQTLLYLCIIFWQRKYSWSYLLISFQYSLKTLFSSLSIPRIFIMIVHIGKWSSTVLNGGILLANSGSTPIHKGGSLQPKKSLSVEAGSANSNFNCCPPVEFPSPPWNIISIVEWPLDNDHMGTLLTKWGGAAEFSPWTKITR